MTRNAVSILLAAASTALLLAGMTDAAQARTRNSTITGPNGKTLQHTVTRDDGNVSSSTIGPNGQSTSRVVTRSAAGTTATITGPKGQSATRVVTRQP